MRIFGALLLSAVTVGIVAGLFVLGGAGVFATVPIAVLTALVFGYPSYFFLRRMGWLRPWQFALAGAVITLPWGLMAPHEHLLWVFITLMGAAAGIVFWWAGVAEPSPRSGVGV
jgi:hypothetical protein